MTTSPSVEAAPAEASEVVCPECGLELQATACVWLSVLPDGRVVPGFPPGDNVSEEMKWYCANDHDTSGVAFTQGLYDKVRDYLEERIA